MLTNPSQQLERLLAVLEGKPPSGDPDSRAEELARWLVSEVERLEARVAELEQNQADALRYLTNASRQCSYATGSPWEGISSAERVLRRRARTPAIRPCGDGAGPAGSP